MMKRLVYGLMAMGLLGVAHGALEIPRHVMTVKQIEEAKAKAAKDKKALTFVLTDPDTT